MPNMPLPSSQPVRPSVASSSAPVIAKILGRVVDGCLWLAVFLAPLIFSSATVDILELNKQTLLVVLTSIAAVAWLGKAFLDKKLSLMQSWLHLVVVLFGFAYLIISLFSQDRYLSLVGSSGQMPWSFATILCLVLFYLIIVNHLKTIRELYDFVFVFLASSLVAGLIALFQMMGWYLFAPSVTHVQTFTTVGTLFSLSTYLATSLVVASALTFHGCRDRACLLGTPTLSGVFARIVVWLSMIVSLIVLVAVDFWAAWVQVMIGTLLIVGLGYWREKKVRRDERLLIPAILFVVSLGLLLFQTPLHFANMPAEVAPNMRASWEVARNALQASPLFGSGPGTWAYDYAKYRPQVVNLSPFWNLRFDRGFSSFMTLLATTGLIGIVLWLILLASAVVKSVTHLIRERNDDVWFVYVTIFAGWVALALSSFFYNFNMTQQILFWSLLALLGNLVTRQVMVWDTRRNAQTYFILSCTLLFFFIAGVCVVWLVGQRWVADRTFAQATQLFKSNKPIAEVTKRMEQAHRLNPWSDLYVRNEAQARMVSVNTIVQNKPTAEQFRAVGDEVKASIDLALQAKEMVPANVENWSNLALMYQSVASFTAKADEHAIDSYLEAHKLEPQNPVFLDEIGKLYLLRADAFRTVAGGKDQKAQDAAKLMAENLALATTYLREALQAKSDYFPAHYHMGIVFERQGRLPEAIAELEQYLKNNKQDAGVAFELAILYYRHQERDRALNLLEQVVSAQPNQVNARWYLAALYEERGMVDQAILQMERLLMIVGSNPAVQQRLDTLKRERTLKRKPSVRVLPDPLSE